MRKRIVSVLLTILTVLLLAACGKKQTPPEPTPEPEPALIVTPSPTPRPTPAQTPNPTPPPLQTPKPTPSPAPTSMPTLTPMPLASASPSPTPTQLSAGPKGPVITKHPNGEAHYVGESAVFSADARDWASLKWTAVSPSGREITMETFLDTFEDCSVSGEKETTLTITNLNIDMSGWSFYCTFENDEGSTKTESARLRVQENTGGSGSGSSGSKSRRLRCPGCGSEVPRDLLNCPYCGAEIYGANEYAVVEKDSNGDIVYVDNTGIMYYESAGRRSTYMDYNTNYAIFNDSGLVQSGNLQKEEEKRREQETLNAIMNGTYVPSIDINSD